MDLYNIPDAAIPCDDYHRFVVPAKLTNDLYEHVEEPEASPTIPSRTASKHNNKQTTNSTTWAFEVVAALWTHEPERRLLQQIATSSCWPIACSGGVRRQLAHSSAWRYNIQSAQLDYQCNNHKPLSTCCSEVDV
jgi:hypothetical protein